MYINQLQLMAEQLKAVQQGTITPEQRELLNMYYNQIVLQYQEASHGSQDIALLPTTQQLQMQMQMQLKYLEDQEKQKYLRQPYLPSLEPEHLQAFLSHIPQVSNAEHLQKLCASLVQQQELVKNEEKDNKTVKDHVARLKRFIPNSQVCSISV